MKRTVEAGTCPNCAGGRLNYDNTPEFNYGGVRITFECRDCKFCGVEKYSLDFLGIENSETFEWFNAGEVIKAKGKK
jgi:hypothetical protein